MESMYSSPLSLIGQQVGFGLQLNELKVDAHLMIHAKTVEEAR